MFVMLIKLFIDKATGFLFIDLVYPFWNRSSLAKNLPQGQTWSCMLEFEVFIGELSTIDWLPTSSISTGEITTLDHKTWYYSMECATFIMERLPAFTNPFLSWNVRGLFTWRLRLIRNSWIATETSIWYLGFKLIYIKVARHYCNIKYRS